MAPQVTPERAWEVATAELARLRLQGCILSDLGPIEDEVAWWSFVVDDVLAQEADVIPGTRRLAVDKIDGHIVGPEEMAEFYALSRSRD
jgi:hypothetical protein